MLRFLCHAGQGDAKRRRDPLGDDEAARLLWRRSRNPDDLYLFASGLPGGGGVFTLLHEGDAEVGEIGVISPEGEITMLGIDGTGARFVPPGYLLWGVKGRGVMVAPFDSRSRRVTGEAVNVLPEAHVKAGGAVPLAMADNAARAAEATGVRQLVINAGCLLPPGPIGVPFLDARHRAAAPMRIPLWPRRRACTATCSPARPKPRVW